MRLRRLALFVPTLGLCATSAAAQIGMNPVQDYINKTSLLNNILSNRRAPDMSQLRQGAGGARSAVAGWSNRSTRPLALPRRT
jgi:hypothetical protein